MAVFTTTCPSLEEIQIVTSIVKRSSPLWYSRPWAAALARQNLAILVISGWSSKTPAKIHANNRVGDPGGNTLEGLPNFSPCCSSVPRPFPPKAKGAHNHRPPKLSFTQFERSRAVADLWAAQPLDPLAPPADSYARPFVQYLGHLSQITLILLRRSFRNFFLP